MSAGRGDRFEEEERANVTVDQARELLVELLPGPLQIGRELPRLALGSRSGDDFWRRGRSAVLRATEDLDDLAGGAGGRDRRQRDRTF